MSFGRVISRKGMVNKMGKSQQTTKQPKQEISGEDILPKDMLKVIKSELEEIKKVRFDIKELKSEEKSHKLIVDAVSEQIRNKVQFDRMSLPALANIDYQIPERLVLDENMLMEEGVPADVIKRCKVKKQGKPFFKISFVGLEEDEE